MLRIQVMGDAFTEYPLVRFKSQISACKKWEFQTVAGDADKVFRV